MNRDYSVTYDELLEDVRGLIAAGVDDCLSSESIVGNIELALELYHKRLRGDAPSSLSQGGDAVIEGDAVVIRFPLEAMQSALDGAWGLNVFNRRQKVTDEAEFAKEFCRELNAESENGTTLIHRMADQAFVNMLEGGAFGFDEHEEQSL